MLLTWLLAVGLWFVRRQDTVAYPQTFLLKAGVESVQITQDSGITAEGPAEYELTTADAMILKYGKLYYHISNAVAGYTVTTPIGTCIALSQADFGIIVYPGGITEIHVDTGSLIIHPGTPPSRTLTAGQAIQIVPNGTMSSIPINSTQFVKDPP